MGNFPSNILSHFAPFHAWLDDLAELSDRAYPEGGVQWRVDFSKRKSDMDKVVLSDRKHRWQCNSPESSKDFNKMWSRFYWNAAGLGGSLQDITLPEEWSAEEIKLTSDYLKAVECMASLFASAQASHYWISFDEDPCWMMINSNTVFENGVLEHSVYWSVD